MTATQRASQLPPASGANDWREVEFCEGVTYGASADSDEMLFMLLGRLLDGEGPSGPASLTFTGAPVNYDRAGSVPRRFESRLRAEGRGDAVNRLLILTLAESPTPRGFLNTTLTKMLSLRPERGADLATYTVERMRRQGVGMVLIESADNIMRCRADERAGMLETLARITTGLGVHIVCAGESTGNSYVATEAPVTLLNVKLARSSARAVLDCLTHRG
jgi:hypothetical protein